MARTNAILMMTLAGMNCGCNKQLDPGLLSELRTRTILQGLVLATVSGPGKLAVLPFGNQYEGLVDLTRPVIVRAIASSGRGVVGKTLGKGLVDILKGEKISVISTEARSHTLSNSRNPQGNRVLAFQAISEVS